MQYKILHLVPLPNNFGLDEQILLLDENLTYSRCYYKLNSQKWILLQCQNPKAFHKRNWIEWTITEISRDDLFAELI